MFKKKPSAEDIAFTKALTTALEELPALTADSDEYTAAIKNIEMLHNLMATNKKSKFRVSGDTLLSVGGSLAGIIMILGYEKANVLTSKALGFVLKTKA